MEGIKKKAVQVYFHCDPLKQYPRKEVKNNRDI